MDRQRTQLSPKNALLDLTAEYKDNVLLDINRHTDGQTGNYINRCNQILWCSGKETWMRVKFPWQSQLDESSLGRVSAICGVFMTNPDFFFQNVEPFLTRYIYLNNSNKNL